MIFFGGFLVFLVVVDKTGIFPTENFSVLDLLTSKLFKMSKDFEISGRINMKNAISRASEIEELLSSL